MTTASASADPHASPAWFLWAEGGLLIVLGLVAIVFPVIAGLATAVLFGWILLMSGVVGLVGAFASRPRVRFAWSLASSVLAIVAGLIICFMPLTGVITLVVVLAAWLALDGVSTMMIAMTLRRAASRSWGWWVLSAVVDWLLAILLLSLTPVAEIVFVGAVVGIDLIFGGIALVHLGSAARKTAA